MVTRIESFSFGRIVIDGTAHRKDVVIYPDGSIAQRKGGLWLFGSHSFESQEIEELEGAEVVALGLGMLSRARLSGPAKEYLRKHDLEIRMLPTREAVNTFNQLIEQGRKAGAILHITC